MQDFGEIIRKDSVNIRIDLKLKFNDRFFYFMSKYACLGNGELLVGFDKWGQIKDIYYHYPGLENHIHEDQVHKLGIWVDGVLHWVDGEDFDVKVVMDNESMRSDVVWESKKFGLKLSSLDCVYNEENILIRQFEIENSFDYKRDIKIFFNQQFNISQTHTGNTAYYDPEDNVVIHYKGRRVFLFNANCGDANISDYAVGLLGIEGKDGTYKDADDGVLSKNGIEHGQVDSTFSISFQLPQKVKKSFDYFMCVDKSIELVKKLNANVLKRKPNDIAKTTYDYWKAWVNNLNFSFYSLSPEIVNLFKKSLYVIRTHTAANGAIIASSDSDMLQFGRDTYAYVWPRDAAVSAIALAKAGDFNASRRFFEFCRDIISPQGYFLHKYRPDKALGSSWHAWIENGERRLPIQEDGTALVVYALWDYYQLSKDLEFVESVYNPIVKNAAEFMCAYIDEKSSLPEPSFDIWEMKYGQNTFTSSCVVGALEVAGKFAQLLGKEKHAKNYLGVAEKVKSAIVNKLWDEKMSYFVKHMVSDGKSDLFDKTVDASSFYGVYKFGILPLNDKKLIDAHRVLIDKLALKSQAGGVSRFEGDQYHHPGGNVPGNPWIITTLWDTQYKIDLVKSESDLANVVSDFTWVTKKALSSGILSEQINAHNSQPLSAAPLIWSHAEYVITVVKYLEKLEELGICKACYPLK
ncbi:MAG: Glycosyl hydrolase, family 15 [Candidatus Woesebacteria bacterium GW2011_GWA1_39_21]|uniref:Glycosyl hydrolase, family 15 n=1 Tax=Candidatus Woesebacteria bacterium GW2011_GWA1_39_21 TaxID=1618550 RepID=A0A0G0QJ32_9BACT|nr:MAG: Glycosyl hydrolase, family 15 [Candidatus Woesebacteria bacterium GW2011_GWA1_39_21]